VQGAKQVWRTKKEDVVQEGRKENGVEQSEEKEEEEDLMMSGNSEVG